jgi:hypothetical protein
VRRFAAQLDAGDWAKSAGSGSPWRLLSHVPQTQVLTIWAAASCQEKSARRTNQLHGGCIREGCGIRGVAVW